MGSHSGVGGDWEEGVVDFSGYPDCAVNTKKAATAKPKPTSFGRVRGSCRMTAAYPIVTRKLNWAIGTTTLASPLRRKA